MLGTIVGDVIGSIYESWMFQGNVKDLNFPIFNSASIFTDDTVLTVATADAILSNRPFHEKYLEWHGKYPNRGYGSGFAEWTSQYRKDKSTVFNSYGNGAMMRVSPIAWACSEIDHVRNTATLSCDFTHNSAEAKRGTQAIAEAIYLARIGTSKDSIKHRMESRYFYDLSPSIEDVRNNFDHRTTRCDITCPQALIVFLNGDNYEDTIRKAIYTLGDCDTIAAISGSIAYAFYNKEIPEELVEFALKKLPLDMRKVINKFMKEYEGKELDPKWLVE